MTHLSREQVHDAVQCANFMQRFKLAYWAWCETPEANGTEVVREKVLDQLAMIAWDEFKKHEAVGR